jgi:O-acetyl-ADP-ribose deacetylase
MPVEVRTAQGNLTKGDELVLVNASNTQGSLGTGVSGAIRAACGPAFQAEVQRALAERFGGPSMPPGAVLVTDAGAHPRARHVAHVAVMDYREGFSARSMPTLGLVRAACVALWRELEALPPPAEGLLSVAMPALGAGTGQLGVRGPTIAACETLAEHLAQTPASRLGRVVFYGYELHEYVAVVDEVSARFQLAEGSVPAEILALVETIRRTPA